MKVKVLVTVLVVLILINLGTIGSFFYFQYQHHREIRRAPWEKFRGSRTPPFHLTPKQREQLDSLRAEINRQNLPKMKEIRRLHHEILRLYRADSVNLKEIIAKMRQISEIRLQMEIETLENMVKAKKYLSPVQQKYLYRILEHSGFYGKRSHFNRKIPRRKGVSP